MVGWLKESVIHKKIYEKRVRRTWSCLKREDEKSPGNDGAPSLYDF